MQANGHQDEDLKKLLERESRFRALMDAAFDGIVISENGIIVEVSEGLLERAGYTRDEVIQHPVTAFIAPEFRDAVEQRIAASVDGRHDTIGLTRSGERRQVEVVSRNHVVGGRRVRLAALRDVTDVRALEHQLQRAQRMEALARLASGIAHDFNNVLFIIQNVAESLVQELHEPHRSAAREILDAADNGAALSRALLTYAREEPIAPRLLDLNAVVRGSEGMLRRIIGRSVRLEMDLAADVGRVRADPMQLQQLMLNLGANARDAMADGGTLTVRTRHVVREAGHAMGQRAGSFVVLQFADSGAGMSDEVKSRIFDPFFTTKEAGKGTGLGLAIVQQIVERSGGFIDVDSAPGAGTTFAIHLPRVPV